MDDAELEAIAAKRDPHDIPRLIAEIRRVRAAFSVAPGGGGVGGSGGGFTHGGTSPSGGGGGGSGPGSMWL